MLHTFDWVTVTTKQKIAVGLGNGYLESFLK